MLKIEFMSLHSTLFYNAPGSIRLTYVPDPLINSIYRIGSQGGRMVKIVIFLLLSVIYEDKMIFTQNAKNRLGIGELQAMLSPYFLLNTWQAPSPCFAK